MGDAGQVEVSTPTAVDAGFGQSSPPQRDGMDLRVVPQVGESTSSFFPSTVEVSHSHTSGLGINRKFHKTVRRIKDARDKVSSTLNRRSRSHGPTSREINNIPPSNSEHSYIQHLASVTQKSAYVDLISSNIHRHIVSGPGDLYAASSPSSSSKHASHQLSTKPRQQQSPYQQVIPQHATIGSLTAPNTISDRSTVDTTQLTHTSQSLRSSLLQSNSYQSTTITTTTQYLSPDNKMLLSNQQRSISASNAPSPAQPVRQKQQSNSQQSSDQVLFNRDLHALKQYAYSPSVLDAVETSKTLPTTGASSTAPFVRNSSTFSSTDATHPSSDRLVVPNNYSSGYYSQNLSNTQNVTLELPEIFLALGERIKQFAQTTEGVFRIASTKDQQKLLRSQLEAVAESEDSMDEFRKILLEWQDAHACCSLFKAFIRGLNGTHTQLIPKKKYMKLVALGGALMKVEETEGTMSKAYLEKYEKLERLIKKIKAPMHDSLDYLIEVLVHVSQYEHVNKMSTLALAIVIGPNLFDPAKSVKGLRENQITNQLLRLLIEKHQHIFVENRSPVTRDLSDQGSASSSLERLLDTTGPGDVGRRRQVQSHVGFDQGSLSEKHKKKKKRAPLRPGGADNKENFACQSDGSVIGASMEKRKIALQPNDAYTYLKRGRRSIVTDIINKRVELFFSKDDGSVDLVSVNELDSASMTRQKAQSMVNGGGDVSGGGMTPDTNTDSSTVKQKLGPSRRPPSKSHVQNMKQNTKGDVFNELETRRIQNIGRIESIRAQNRPQVRSPTTYAKPALDTSTPIPTLVQLRKESTMDTVSSISSKTVASTAYTGTSITVIEENSRPYDSIQGGGITPNPALTDTERRMEELTRAMIDILQRMDEKRHMGGRTGALDTYSAKQLLEEKSDLQKELLRFEGVYGRPSVKDEKAKVRPVYDQYRAVKHRIKNFPDQQQIAYWTANSRTNTLGRQGSTSNTPTGTLERGRPTYQHSSAGSHSSRPAASSQVTQIQSPLSVPDRKVTVLSGAGRTRDTVESSQKAKQDEVIQKMESFSIDHLENLRATLERDYQKLGLMIERGRREYDVMLREHPGQTAHHQRKLTEINQKDERLKQLEQRLLEANKLLKRKHQNITSASGLSHESDQAHQQRNFSRHGSSTASAKSSVNRGSFQKYN